MPETSTFGRRQAQAARAKPTPPAAAAPGRSPAQPQLSAAAEAFRAELAAGKGAPAHDFEAWLRSRRSRQALMLAATIGSFAPGVATFLLDAPPLVSTVLGGGALLGNIWLRRERFRRRREIIAWGEASDEV